MVLVVLLYGAMIKELANKNNIHESRLHATNRMDKGEDYKQNTNSERTADVPKHGTTVKKDNALSMALVPHSTKIRIDQKDKLQRLAEKMKCSKNQVIIKLIDKARI